MPHTPAPWEVQTSCSWRRIGTPGNDGDVICPTVNPRDGHPDLIASEADLKLAASAPELLEFLAEGFDKVGPLVEGLSDEASPHSYTPILNDNLLCLKQWLGDAAIAIAKARGEA